MMRKILMGLVLAALLLTSVSCTGVPTGQGDPNAPPDPADEYEREELNIYLDGEALKESGYRYADIKKFMAGKEIDGVYYFGARLADIMKKDLSAVKGAVLEATDGYVSYISGIEGLYLAAYAAENGVFESINRDGKHLYDGVVAGDNINKGLANIYLVSTPINFMVEIQKNGQKIGELGMADFMRKTAVGEKKVSTGFFEGSFMYDGGASTYEGQFLGISYDTMLAKLEGLGMDLSGTIVEVEYYGTSGLGKEGKNLEYSTTEGDSKYYGSLDFTCLIDGMTINSISDTPLGLTAFINGTGGRWMTHNLSAINFIVE